MKTCNTCKIAKISTDFHCDRAKKDGRSGSCKTCATERANRWQRANRDAVNKNSRRYRERHGEHVKARNRKRAVRVRAELRRAALTAYSGEVPSCACCGERHVEFLEIDHVNNDGAKHRREINGGGGTAVLRWLKSNRYPKGFQVLCRNCNFAKHLYGQCPHQRDRQALS